MKNLMGSKYLLVLVSLLSANPRAWADTLEFANGQTMKTEEISPEETADNFQYGIVKINYTSAAVTQLKLNENGYKILPDALFVTEAQASLSPIDQSIFTAGLSCHEALRAAMSFKDIKPFITNDAYQKLLSKSSAGAKEILVLQLLKNSIPEQVDIIQTQIKGDFAWVIARGKMKGQDFWGTLALGREQGQWKLVQETWYGHKGKTVVVHNMRNADDFLNQINDRPSNDFVTWVQTAGRPKTSLPLEYGKIRTPKNSFCFFFFLNPEKQTKKNDQDPTPRMAAAHSPDMHLVWPTSGVRYDPKAYKHTDETGFDISVAADKDGYYPNKMNLRLPIGKPKEVYVGFLLSF